MKTVADLMTKEVVTLDEKHDLALADTILRLGRIRHLPVVRDGKLVGLVTHRDVLRCCANRSRHAAHHTLAEDVMTRDVTTVRPNTPLHEAIDLMIAHKFGCLPVVEENGTLVGILTEADFVRLAAALLGTSKG